MEGLEIPKESALVPTGSGDLFRNLKRGNKISRFVFNKEHQGPIEEKCQTGYKETSQGAVMATG